MIGRIIIALLLVFASIVDAYDTLATRQVSNGVFYVKLADTAKPVVIDVLTIDLLDTTISIDVAVANGGLNLGGERTSDLIARKQKKGDKILAGINADFFGNKPMQAQNSIIANGEIVKAVNLKRTQIAFANNNKPTIGRFKFLSKGLNVKGINANDTTLASRLFTHHWKGFIKKRSDKNYAKFLYDGKINPNIQEILIFDRRFVMPDSIETDNSFLLFEYDNQNALDDTLKVIFDFSGLSGNIKTMTGGLPSLFYKATIPGSYIGRDGMKSKRFLDLNPRTAVGYDENKTTLFIVTADGRQPKRSMGFSIKELADFMFNLGCYDALNLDGGGSTAMCIGDSVVNSPSDFSGERPVYNSLLVRSRE